MKAQICRNVQAGKELKRESQSQKLQVFGRYSRCFIFSESISNLPELRLFQPKIQLFQFISPYGKNCSFPLRLEACGESMGLNIT